VKAALALDLLTDAASFCRKGLEQDPANEEFKKLLSEVDAKLREQDRQRAKVAQAITKAKVSFCPTIDTAILILEFKYVELTRPIECM